MSKFVASYPIALVRSSKRRGGHSHGILAWVALVSAGIVVGCSSTPDDPVVAAVGATSVGDNGETEEVIPLPAEEEAPEPPKPSDPPPPPKATTEFVVTGDLNLRSTPEILEGNIVGVMPRGTKVKLLAANPTNGFYNVDVPSLSKQGWCSGKYLNEVTPGGTPTPGAPGDLNGPASPENALARAKPAVGFSYYWGGGAYLATGPTDATKGSCSGNCPDCTHQGKYGADCSGLIAKTWQYGALPLEQNDHPFSTADFVQDKANYWSTVSDRKNAKLADAAVYREGGAGHIVMYEKGDAWGSPFVYECTGCKIGCVYGAKKLAAKYKFIRRDKF
jgi:hypothetical protein